jgi:hypothetical protein
MILRGAIIFGFAWLVLTQTPQPGIMYVPFCVADACAGVSLNAWQDHVILHLAEMKQDLRTAAITREQRGSLRIGSEGSKLDPDPVSLNAWRGRASAHGVGYKIPFSRVFRALHGIKSNAAEFGYSAVGHHLGDG